MANARKYGRKLENFDKIYSYIIDKIPKSGKTNDEIEIIMDEILPHYGLCYEKIDNINILKKFFPISFEIKILIFKNKRWNQMFGNFYLNNKELDNFL